MLVHCACSAFTLLATAIQASGCSPLLPQISALLTAPQPAPMRPDHDMLAAVKSVGVMALDIDMAEATPKPAHAHHRSSPIGHPDPAASGSSRTVRPQRRVFMTDPGPGTQAGAAQLCLCLSLA